MDVLDRVYYTRAILGVIAGLVIIPGTDQGEVMGIIILTALVFYLLSYCISRRISLTIQKSNKRKLATDGIFPFIFLLLMFMILVYTVLHQELAL